MFPQQSLKSPIILMQNAGQNKSSFCIVACKATVSFHHWVWQAAFCSRWPLIQLLSLYLLLFPLLSFVFLLFFLSLRSHQGSFCRKLALNLVGDPFLSECHLKKRLHYFFSILLAIPLKTEGVSFRAMEYSPLLGGFAVVLADGRGGFLSADTASFECSVSMICSDSTLLAILNFLCVLVN